MRNLMNLLSVWFGFFLMVAVSYDTGQTYCVIFPQNGRDVFGIAQRNILVFGETQVSLIPQVHFEGNARDFGILVPVPAVPTLSTVGANIFSEASFLTQPLVRQGSDGCGCDGDNQIFSPVRVLNQGALAVADESGSGVTVIPQANRPFDSSRSRRSMNSAFIRASPISPGRRPSHGLAVSRCSIVWGEHRSRP